jgi:hypothetical protein
MSAAKKRIGEKKTGPPPSGKIFKGVVSGKEHCALA